MENRLRNQINEDSWLHFTNNNFPTHTLLKEILDQPVFLNPHTKLDFSSDSPYFYCIPSRNTLGKFVIIRDLCRFLQQGLISYTTFDEKLGFPTANHKRIYKLITDFESTCLDWNFTKSLLKFFYYNNKRTKKVKDFPKLSN